MPINFDFNNPTIQAAIVAATGVIVSTASALYIARRNIHKDARSRARVEWMESLRLEISKLVDAIDKVRRMQIQGDEMKIASCSGDMLRAQIRIVLLLNEDDKEQKPLADEVQRCVQKVLDAGLTFDPELSLAEILKRAKKVLQLEWRKASHGK